MSFHIAEGVEMPAKLLWWHNTCTGMNANHSMLLTANVYMSLRYNLPHLKVIVMQA
jgi:hypothetical protein